MIELTKEQRQAVSTQEPLWVTDPETQKRYALMSQEAYESLLARLADGGPSRQQVSLLVNRVMAEDDANDPSLEYYQQTYGKKS